MLIILMIAAAVTGMFFHISCQGTLLTAITIPFCIVETVKFFQGKAAK